MEAVECTGTVGGSGVYWHCWRQWSVLVLLEAVECTGTVRGSGVYWYCWRHGPTCLPTEARLSVDLIRGQVDEAPDAAVLAALL